MKLERTEENFLLDALQSRIEYLQKIYGKHHKEDISGKSPHYRTPLKNLHNAAGSIIELERLIRTQAKQYEIKKADFDRLLKGINELKNYIDPNIMKKKEEEEKEWLEKNPERKNNLL